MSSPKKVKLSDEEAAPAIDTDASGLLKDGFSQLHELNCVCETCGQLLKQAKVSEEVAPASDANADPTKSDGKCSNEMDCVCATCEPKQSEEAEIEHMAMIYLCNCMDPEDKDFKAMVSDEIKTGTVSKLQAVMYRKTLCLIQKAAIADATRQVGRMKGAEKDPIKQAKLGKVLERLQAMNDAIKV